MGVAFYRNMDPRRMGYAELRYFAKWHEVIAQTEQDAVDRVRNAT